LRSICCLVVCDLAFAHHDFGTDLTWFGLVKDWLIRSVRVLLGMELSYISRLSLRSWTLYKRRVRVYQPTSTSVISSCQTRPRLHKPTLHLRSCSSRIRLSPNRRWPQRSRVRRFQASASVHFPYSLPYNPLPHQHRYHQKRHRPGLLWQSLPLRPPRPPSI
jgi:hypothetical protein